MKWIRLSAILRVKTFYFVDFKMECKHNGVIIIALHDEIVGRYDFVTGISDSRVFLMGFLRNFLGQNFILRLITKSNWSFFGKGVHLNGVSISQG